jgi:hypothetical protein
VQQGLNHRQDRLLPRKEKTSSQQNIINNISSSEVAQTQQQL